MPQLNASSWLMESLFFLFLVMSMVLINFPGSALFYSSPLYSKSLSFDPLLMN